MFEVRTAYKNEKRKRSLFSKAIFPKINNSAPRPHRDIYIYFSRIRVVYMGRARNSVTGTTCDRDVRTRTQKGVVARCKWTVALPRSRARETSWTPTLMFRCGGSVTTEPAAKLGRPQSSFPAPDRVSCSPFARPRI